MIPGTPSSNSRIAVVIVTRDRPHVIPGCLRSIQRQTPQPDEIFIVAGNERSCPPSLLTEFSELPIKLIRCPLPNICIARNMGLDATECEVVCFIDDDAIAHAGWIEAYIEAFRDQPDAAAAGGVVLDGRCSTRTVEFEYGLISPTGRQIECRPNRQANQTKRGYTKSVKGCNFALHTRRLPEGIRFDEFFRFAFDETDLILTIQEMGGSILHTPHAVVDHLHAPGLYRTARAHDRDWRTEFASHTMFMMKHTKGTVRLLGWGVVLARLGKHAARLIAAAAAGTTDQRRALDGILDACSGIRLAVMSRDNG